MDRFEKDKTGKWLISNYGDLLLRHFGGTQGIQRWVAGATDITIPRQIPDGLLEVWRPHQKTSSPFLVEIATYPDKRVNQQLLTDIAVVYGATGKIPDTLVLVLKPKHQAVVASEFAEHSHDGLTSLKGVWKVVNLWEVEAEPMLAAEEAGLAPWVMLMKTEDSPQILTQKVRNIIDAKAKDHEDRLNLLASAQVFANARFKNPSLRDILGGQTIMIDAPILRQIRRESGVAALHEAILDMLDEKFGEDPSGSMSRLVMAITNIKQLRGICRQLLVISTKDEFVAKLNEIVAKR